MRRPWWQEISEEDKTVLFGVKCYRYISDAYRKQADADEDPDSCGDDHDDHEWRASAEIDGGCDSNPGCFSTGGTSFVFSSHCKYCGVRCFEVKHGSQRNPDDEDGCWYHWDASHLKEEE